MSEREDSQPFLVFGAPAIEQDEIDEVVATMRSGWLGTGPRTAQLEKEFAEYTGCEHAVAFNSCTAALHLSMIALDLQPGDEVITTPLTFASTANSIIHAGGTPVLADVDRRTMNIDLERVREKITPRTRAILPVHFAGRPADILALCDLADSHGIEVIEDCAHAVETTVGDRHVGTFGRFGCFSFYVTKNMTTVEGGMILARNADDAGRLKTLGLHGLSRDAWKRFGDEGYKHYYVVGAGFKYNMTDMQAAVGIHQLRRIEPNLERRNQVWQMYLDALADLPVQLPEPEAPGTRHARHLFTLLIDEDRAGISRDDFLAAMTRLGIGVGVHYLSLPEHPYYQERYGWRPEDCPAAMDIGRQTVSLPLTAWLNDDQVQRVIGAVRSALGNASR